MFARQKCLEKILTGGIFAWVMVALPRLGLAEETATDTTTGPARPPPLASLEPTPLPVSRHVDIGAAVAVVERVVEGQTNGVPSIVRFPPTVGVGLSARIDVFRYMRASVYVLRGSTTVNMPAGALGLPGDPGPMPLTGYSFGLRLSPSLPLGPRARTWLNVGMGWGRLEMGRFDVANAGGSYQVRERAFSFVEFPMGIGTSIDIIKNWLAIEFEANAAFHVAQRGTALRNGQAIDNLGHRVPLGPFPSMTASFIQTLGLALIL